jgi:hypothetical protein
MAVLSGAALLSGACAPKTDGSAVSLDNLPRWTLTNDLRVGEQGTGNYTMNRVSRMLVDARGKIHVVLIREMSVRVFDSLGAYVRTIGKRGQGPGEFTRMDGMGFRGDSLWIASAAGKKVSLFAPDGSLAREFTIAPVSPDTSLVGGRVEVLSPDGNLLLSFNQPNIFIDFDTPTVLTYKWYSAARDGILRDSVASLTTRHMGVWWESINAAGSTATYVTEPFRDYALSEGLADGSALVLIDRAAPTRSDSAFVTVTRIDPVTRSAGSRAYAFSPVRVSAAVSDSVFRRAVSGFDSAYLNRNIASLRQRAFSPTYLPFATSALVGNDGSVWLEDGWTTKRWVVIDADGTPIASVAMPEGFQPRVVNSRQAWGYEETSEGIPLVTRYSLQPAPS